MIHQVNMQLGDTVMIEIFQTTSVDRRNVASLEVTTPGLIAVSVEKHERDLVVVTHVEG